MDPQQVSCVNCQAVKRDNGETIWVCERCGTENTAQIAAADASAAAAQADIAAAAAQAGAPLVDVPTAAVPPQSSVAPAVDTPIMAATAPVNIPVEAPAQTTVPTTPQTTS